MAPARPHRPWAAQTAPARHPPFRVRALVTRLWRDHRLITIAVTLSLLPRILAVLAFRPAQFTPDSFSYMAEGAHPGLSQWHPAGYPVFLWLLMPFHALLLVTTVQHLMGIATAVAVYALLRRWDLPGWGATLAACPVLFDSRQITLESSILPDVLYGLLLVAAVAVLLTRRALTAGPVRGGRGADVRGGDRAGQRGSRDGGGAGRAGGPAGRLAGGRRRDRRVSPCHCSATWAYSRSVTGTSR